MGRPQKKGRGLVLGVSIGAVALIAIAGVYFFVIKPKDTTAQQTRLNTQVNAQMKNEESAATEEPPSIPVEPPIKETAAPDPLEEKVTQLKSVFDSSQFDEAIKLGEAIIGEDSDNAEALDIVKRAKQKKENIVRLANNAVAARQIKQIIERQRQAEESKELLLLLNDVGSSFLERRREAATFVFNNFEDIKSAYSNISVTITVAKRAEARFSYLLTGVHKTTKKRGIIDEGEKTWLFEKQGNTWMIVGRK
jgi:hypothetical protein